MSVKLPTHVRGKKKKAAPGVRADALLPKAEKGYFSSGWSHTSVCGPAFQRGRFSQNYTRL